MKISNESQLQELIKKEIASLIETPEKDNIKQQIDKEWQWLEGSLYGHGGRNDGMLSAWRQGIVNNENITIGAIENATKAAHRVRSVLHYNKNEDPNIASALESIDKLMSKMVTVRMQLLQAFGQLSSQPERLEQKISDIQSVNEGFLSQLFGYAYTALERNGLLTRLNEGLEKTNPDLDEARDHIRNVIKSKELPRGGWIEDTLRKAESILTNMLQATLEEDALEEGKCPPGHYWKSFGGQGGTCVKDPDYKGPKSAYSQGGTVSPPRGSHTPKYEE